MIDHRSYRHRHTDSHEQRFQIVGQVQRDNTAEHISANVELRIGGIDLRMWSYAHEIRPKPAIKPEWPFGFENLESTVEHSFVHWLAIGTESASLQPGLDEIER